MENKIKVLICDNTISGTKMASDLSKLGLHAITRRNNAEIIINSIITEKPDVVISDINVNGSDAVSVMRTVRSVMPSYPAFVVFSDVYSSFIEKQALASGVSSFLFAPFTSEELYSAVMSSVRKKVHEQYDIEIIVTDMMQKIGIPANIKGYRYIRTAVIECLDDCNCLNCITKCLYPAVAKKHETTAPRVERAIRHAICTTWEQNSSIVNSFFGYNRKNEFNRPTNSEFISLMTDKTRLLVKSGSHFSCM